MPNDLASWLQARKEGMRNLRRRIQFMYERVSRELSVRPEMSEALEAKTRALENSLADVESKSDESSLPNMLKEFGAQLRFLEAARAYVDFITRADFVESLRRVVSELNVTETLRIRDRLVQQIDELNSETTSGYALVPERILSQLEDLETPSLDDDLGLLIALAKRAPAQTRAALDAKLHTLRETVLGAPPASLLTTMRASELLCLMLPLPKTAAKSSGEFVMGGRVAIPVSAGLLDPPKPIRYAEALTGIPDEVLSVSEGNKLSLAATSQTTAVRYDRTPYKVIPLQSFVALAYKEHLWTGIETRVHLPANAAWGDPQSEEWEFPTARVKGEGLSLRELVRGSISTPLFEREAAAAALVAISSAREPVRPPRVQVLEELLKK